MASEIPPVMALEVALDEVPEVAQETAPGAAQEAAPEVAQETAPEAAQEAAPEVAQETAPEAAQEAAPEAAPEAAQEAAPEVARETAPEAAQEAAPEAAQEAAVQVNAEVAPEEVLDAAPKVVPAPSAPEQVIRSKTMQQFPVSSEHYVQVTYIDHPHNFYVRLRQHEELLPTVSTPGDPIDAAEVKTAAHVVFYSPQAHTTVRGKISLVDPIKETCDIFAVDYGFTEKNISIKSLFQSPQARKTPSLARNCQLAHCQPIGKSWSEDSIEAMKYYLGEERTKIIVRGHLYDTLLVDLYNTCPDDVATMLALTGYTTLGARHTTLFVQPFPIPNMRCFTFRQLEPGTKLHVRTLTGRSLRSFYVAEISDYQKYVEERDNFHTTVRTSCSSLPPADMQKGEPISVFSNDRLKYERAVITQVNLPESKAFVWYVDQGGQGEASIEDMKCLPDKWLERPAAAIYCALPKDQAKAPELQVNLQPGREFHITVKSLGKLLEEPNIVHIDELVEVK